MNVTEWVYVQSKYNPTENLCSHVPLRRPAGVWLLLQSSNLGLTEILWRFTSSLIPHLWVDLLSTPTPLCFGSSSFPISTWCALISGLVWLYKVLDHLQQAVSPVKVVSHNTQWSTTTSKRKIRQYKYLRWATILRHFNLVRFNQTL